MSPTLKHIGSAAGEAHGPWKPWAALAGVPPLATRPDLKPSFFLGSRVSIGDAREILQGNGHRNQLVAVAINGDVAARIERAVNCHDDLLAAAKRVLDGLNARLDAAAAADAPSPIFQGIGDLHSAIAKAEGRS